VLPSLTLGLIFLAIYLRIMRASMLEVLNLDYVRTARAKGLDETGVIVRHVLRNALLPMVTLIGLQAGTMLGGSVVVESVFSLPALDGWLMSRSCSATSIRCSGSSSSPHCW